jgi:hypothetical protein
VNILELFCGTKSFTKAAAARGHECRTLDNDPQFKPTYRMNILDFEPSVLEGWQPDIVWASPPCQCFSVMVIGKNWEKREVGKDPQPKREEVQVAMNMAVKAINLIAEVKPRYWFIENPRGMLRQMPFMRGWHRSTVTYCKYGMKYQKATDIWNNCFQWMPKPVCSKSSPCDGRLAEGYVGVQRKSLHPFDIKQERGWDRAMERAIVPPQLCEEIIIACESGGEKG